MKQAGGVQKNVNKDTVIASTGAHASTRRQTWTNLDKFPPLRKKPYQCQIFGEEGLFRDTLPFVETQSHRLLERYRKNYTQ